jgi:hypothetical protein
MLRTINHELSRDILKRTKSHISITKINLFLFSLQIQTKRLHQIYIQRIWSICEIFNNQTSSHHTLDTTMENMNKSRDGQTFILDPKPPHNEI